VPDQADFLSAARGGESLLLCAAGEMILGHLTVKAASPLLSGGGSAGLFA
jgi:hypothetical protein